MQYKHYRETEIWRINFCKLVLQHWTTGEGFALSLYPVPFFVPTDRGKKKKEKKRIFFFFLVVTLLRKARERREILCRGTKILFYQDFSAYLQKRRAAFKPIKHMLQQNKMEYALLYPARMRVSTTNSIHFFDSPLSVERWLEDNRKTPRNTAGQETRD